MASGLHQGWSGDSSSDVSEGSVVHPDDEFSVIGASDGLHRKSSSRCPAAMGPDPTISELAGLEGSGSSSRS